LFKWIKRKGIEKEKRERERERGKKKKSFCEVDKRVKVLV
jgi:hypothetical protein